MRSMPSRSSSPSSWPPQPPRFPWCGLAVLAPHGSDIVCIAALQLEVTVQGARMEFSVRPQLPEAGVTAPRLVRTPGP
jgi:hypothetical protein